MLRDIIHSKDSIDHLSHGAAGDNSCPVDIGPGGPNVGTVERRGPG